MAYEYYEAYLGGIANSPKDDYHEEMQANVAEAFYNSPNWYTIEEEDDFGSETYSNTNVRIGTVINPSTGANQGDDWRKLTYPDIDKVVKIGQLYRFDDNYWIVVSSHVFSGVTTSSIIRRCNDTLRWITESGAKHSVPCVLDYRIQENRDYASGTSKFKVAAGILEIITQRNEKTNLIRPSHRFLFGNSDNWTAYEVYGGGINNFNNYTTFDLESGHLLTITSGVTQLNEEIDDLTNGYANNGEKLYAISLDFSSIEASISDTVQLSEGVTLNGESVDRDVSWSTSDEAVATVSSSGLVTMVDNGIASIRASLDGDDTIYDECSVVVSVTPSDGYDISISPTTNYLLEGDSETYTFTLNNNGIPQADTFTFAVVSASVPTDNYNLIVVDGNTITIENVKMYLSENLVVRGTSGANTKDLSILLKGSW